MICQHCSLAADIPYMDKILTPMVKKDGHSKCRGGTWCDCQHRVARKSIV